MHLTKFIPSQNYDAFDTPLPRSAPPRLTFTIISMSERNISHLVGLCLSGENAFFLARGAGCRLFVKMSGIPEAEICIFFVLAIDQDQATDKPPRMCSW